MDMEKRFETPGAVRLSVHNEVGRVRVTAHPARTTVVALQAVTPGAEELVERALVECKPVGSGHIVTVKVPKLHGLRFVRRNAVVVRVDMPEGSELTVVAGSADLDVTGRIGSADVTTSSGDVSMDDIASHIRAKTASGDITVGNVGGDLRVATASGDLRCSSVSGSAFFATASGDLEVGAAGDALEVKATSGNVRLGELARGARIISVSGDVRVLAVGDGDLHVRSVSGDVSVGVARGVDLHVDAESLSGTVNSAIPLESTPGRRRADTTVDLHVRSVSGNVEIAPALEEVA